MKEMTASDQEYRIFHQGNRLFYIHRDVVMIICTHCGGALATHTFVPQSQVRFPFMKQCMKEGDHVT